MNNIARFTQTSTPQNSTPLTSLGSIPAHDAAELTGPAGLAHIRLGDAIYTLRITRAGKLILTK